MFKASTVGDVGEVLTASTLRNECNMTIVRNIYIPYQNKTTEIDIIGVSPSGIYVIENKNIKGTVRCELYSSTWNVVYNSGETYEMLSPIHQNNYHIKALKELLKSQNKEDLIKLLKARVIFNDSADLVMCGSGVCPLTLTEFVQWYKKYDVKENLIGKQEICDIVEFLRTYSDSSDKARLLHIQRLYSNKNS